MISQNFSTTSVSADLTIVARELAALIDRLMDSATCARGLSAATDWQAKAATAFHENAAAWAGEISGLVCLAETARIDAEGARNRAALIESSPFPQLFAPSR